MQQLRHPAPACRASGHETGGGVAVHGTVGEPAGTRSHQSTAWYWSFPGTALDVSLSRRWLAAAVEALWGAGEDTDRLVLAYSEVATNAVVHGRGPVSVGVRLRSDGAVCEVADCSARPPQPRRAAPEDVSGRGLDLVGQTVDRLRTTTDEAGKTIRFEIARRPGGSGGSPPRESAEGPLGVPAAGAPAGLQNSLPNSLPNGLPNGLPSSPAPGAGRPPRPPAAQGPGGEGEGRGALPDLSALLGLGALGYGVHGYIGYIGDFCDVGG